MGTFRPARAAGPDGNGAAVMVPARGVGFPSQGSRLLGPNAPGTRQPTRFGSCQTATRSADAPPLLHPPRAEGAPRTHWQAREEHAPPLFDDHYLPAEEHTRETLQRPGRHNAQALPPPHQQQQQQQQEQQQD
eukprot:GHVT01019951.1.p3 GENE.GHVT01019951.1~~GHVT01019951.1.p3  ORF type:complete len:133 (-),score=44.02 GHVT01019951.1:7-405(-)